MDYRVGDRVVILKRPYTEFHCKNTVPGAVAIVMGLYDPNDRYAYYALRLKIENCDCELSNKTNLGYCLGLSFGSIDDFIRLLERRDEKPGSRFNNLEIE